MRMYSKKRRRIKVFEDSTKSINFLYSISYTVSILDFPLLIISTVNL